MRGPRAILIYDDAGADPFCVACLSRALRDAGHAVRTIDAPALLAGEWQDGCAALAFPGGADRPYADKLDGTGNRLIREYVEAGGRYFGVCAGAYYACRSINFTGDDFSVRGDRELGFFPGTAVGSLDELAAPYRVQDLRCSGVAELNTGDGPAEALYWGGCRFDPDPGADGVEVLARYAALPSGRNTAALRVGVGGGAAVLVGVHAEVSGEDFNAHRHDYHNGDAAHPRAVAARLAAQDGRRSRFFAGLLRALLF